MPSYFLAINLPDDVSKKLVKAQPTVIPGMRLIGREELHLTVHFIGDLNAAAVIFTRVALLNLKKKAFSITINGIGKFPTAGEPQVLWAGVESTPPLIAFHELIGAALTDVIGFQPEEHPYFPHISLARLNEPAPPDVIEKYLVKQEELHISPVLVDNLVFYSSEMIDNVPRYQEEATFYLD